MFWAWPVFLAFVLALLALDLGVFHRTAHAIRFREAMWWSAFWIALSLAFGGLVYAGYEHHWLGMGSDELTGSDAALEYYSGYLLEKSLSIDNIFVMAIIFGRFKVPAEYQHRVLFWGILGALVFRGAMIAAGITALRTFGWMFYVFGALLMVTAIKMLLPDDSDPDPRNSRFAKFVERILPVTNTLDGPHFITRVDGRRMFTRLALVLFIIEASDVLFALDSVPAVFAVTLDPFIVFSSNVMAILGLRALYFALAGLLDKFGYLEMSLAFVLGFVAAKMLLFEVYHIPTWVSLLVIATLLAGGVIVSLIATRNDDDLDALEADAAEPGGSAE